MASAVSRDLDRQIAMTHKRFIKAMDARVPDMRQETKERYLAVVSMLAAKLDDASKPLRDVLQEMMAEAASVILEEIGSF
jgi:hypothetical protein